MPQLGQQRPAVHRVAAPPPARTCLSLPRRPRACKGAHARVPGGQTLAKRGPGAALSSQVRRGGDAAGLAIHSRAGGGIRVAASLCSSRVHERWRLRRAVLNQWKRLRRSSIGGTDGRCQQGKRCATVNRFVHCFSAVGAPSGDRWTAHDHLPLNATQPPVQFTLTRSPDARVTHVPRHCRSSVPCRTVIAPLHRAGVVGPVLRWGECTMRTRSVWVDVWWLLAVSGTIACPSLEYGGYPRVRRMAGHSDGCPGATS